MIRLLSSLMVFLCITGAASAAEINIVAFGASNTYGKGVARGQDFPAQLEAMLKARGHAVRVVNAGVNGETTASMAQRLDAAVPAGTHIVIFQPGGNDRRKGSAGRGSNVAAIVARLNARGIKIIMLEHLLSGMSPQQIQADGAHLTGEGYRVIAARLLPQVVARIGAR